MGPGALGCLLASLFYESGQDVHLVDYKAGRAEELRQRGIQFHTLEGGQRLIKVPIAMAPEVGPCDLTIIAVKAYQTKAAAQALPVLMSRGGMALTLQNGLGNLEAMARVVGPQRLLAGVGLLGVTRQGEGRVIFAGRGTIYIGVPAGSQVSRAEVAAVVEIFRRAGLECQSREDIAAVLWEKLIINVGINPLTALLRVPNGVLLELRPAWEVAVAAAREAQAVGRAEGIRLTGDPAEALRQVCTATAANRSSMLQDILAGRPTEIEALNAQVSTRGRHLGLSTPVNDLLTTLLRAVEQSAPFRVS
ncbi:MAG: ketopantoate reductase family protein [Thermodesulfobacteriota bacterium]